MDYKRIIKSRELRVLLLTFLGWIPDCIMLRLQFRIKTGRRLNLKNPQRFTDKIQLYKLKYRNPDMLRCTDKYEVRRYIEEKGFGEYLIPLIGVYDSVADIDFKSLPNQFVAKTTDGGGGNQVLICKDRAELNEDDFRKRLTDWMSARKIKKQAGREWAYENGYPRRIVIEQYIDPEPERTDLCDYKFFCFNGEPHYCQLIQNRSQHETIDFYDMEWNHQEFYGLNPQSEPAAKPAAKPQNYERMIEVARKLSKHFPFVRVDLYSVAENVFFGELTFYPASGYGFFTPDEWDAKIGALMQIPESKLNGGGKFLVYGNEIKRLNGLEDYKFMCIDGKTEFIYHISERNLGVSAKFGIYDSNFNKIDVLRSDELENRESTARPLHFDRMKALAEALAKDFPHVRVDLYNIGGKIYFGELTFYDGSGYYNFIPDSFDYEMGRKFIICSDYSNGGGALIIIELHAADLKERRSAA